MSVLKSYPYRATDIHRKLDTGPSPARPPVFPPPLPDSFPLLDATDSSLFETRAALLLDTLRSAGSLLAWRGSHREEVVERAQNSREFDDGPPLEGAWCARSVRRERLRDGRVVLRSAFFYPPDSVAPDVGMDVPVGLEMIASCRAGAISLESEEPEPGVADSLTRALRSRLTARYGDGRDGARLLSWQAGDWRRPTLWRLPAATVVATAEGRAWIGRVFVLAWKPSSGISRETADGASLRRDPETAMLRDLIALGPLGGPEAERLIALRAAAHWAWLGLAPDTLTDAGLRSQLEPWVRTADRLPPRPRAARLLLADRVLDAARLPSRFAAESLTTRAWLERLGARFERQPLGGGDYAYVNNWLWEAYRVDPKGPVGRWAWLVLLRSAFHTGVGCGGDDGYRDEGFRRVIAEGEAALAGPLDPGLRAEVEQVVAEAYGDVIFLSRGGGYAPDSFQPEAYRADAPVARREALRHYEAALSLIADPLTRTRVGQAAWRLRVGLTPLGPHFICVYD